MDSIIIIIIIILLWNADIFLYKPDCRFH